MLSEVAKNTKGQARGQKEKNRRTGAEEQERDNKKRKTKNRRTGTAPTPGRTRTERLEQKNKNYAKEQKNRTTEQDQRTREAPTGQKTRKRQAKITPAPSPPSHQRHPPRCLAAATNKTTDKTTNTEHRHSCCRPNCTRPFGPRSVVTSTIPPLTGRATRLFYFFFPDPPPPPFGGSGEKTK